MWLGCFMVAWQYNYSSPTLNDPDPTQLVATFRAASLEHITMVSQDGEVLCVGTKMAKQLNGPYVPPLSKPTRGPQRRGLPAKRKTPRKQSFLQKPTIPTKIVKRLVHVGCLTNSKAVRVCAYFSPCGRLLHKQWPGGGIISPREIKYKAQYKGRPHAEICDMILELLKAKLSHLLDDGEV